MRYGTRAMLFLALHAAEGPSNVQEIADDQNLSVKYLEQPMSALLASGLVRSVRGAGGGYVLADPPDQIPLSRLLDVFEGPPGLVECTCDPTACHRSPTCVTQEVWAEMYLACRQVLENTTLADLVLRHHVKVAGAKVASAKVAGAKVASAKVAGAKVASAKVAGATMMPERTLPF